MTRPGLAYLNNPKEAEALAFGYGLPPQHIVTELHVVWRRLRARGVALPAERRIISNRWRPPVRTRRLSRTQINLYWGLAIGDHRLKRWKGSKWSVEFLLDGYPCGGGLSVDPRTVQALIRAGWIDRDGRPVLHEVGARDNA